MSLETLNKIPPPKHGTEFLASTHFNIGHEPQWSVNQDPAAYRSTFKKDYPPQPIEKREKTKLLPPADIMHRDEKIGENHFSVTREHYGLKPLNKTGYGNLPYSLTATNFKMDADEKIKSFHTTHNEYFYKKSLKDVRDKSAMKDWSKSHIPQGDREKIKWLESDYKSHFVPITRTQEKEQPSGVVDAPPTIKGDIRIHQNALYNTTTKDCFPSRYQKRIIVDEKVRYPASHIPQGDQEKCHYLQSTQKEDYKHRMGTGKTSTENEALAKLKSTNLRMGDPRLDSFRSTVQDSFQYIPGQGRKVSAKKVLNKSNLPEGDSDYLKNVQRFGTTVHRSQFKAPPSDYRTQKIDGSQLRTLSKVHLGNDQRLNSYETTMDDNFRSLPSSFQKALGNVHSSSIPTDFYKDLITQPTYRTDYSRRDEMTKLEPNPTALNMLKRSNVNITDPSFKEFDTTHKATYTPKKNERERVIELGKLQKSSVPLGTLSR